ncbi:MAG: hypothetical protein JWL79_3509 [Frankiales bacterium]|nr:hypothetical protein [Frankiales bacterium]
MRVEAGGDSGISSSPSGVASHTDSPVSHTDTSAPEATATEATVSAWRHRSGASAPAVSFTTRERTPDTLAPVTIEYFYTGLLVAAFLAIAWFSGYVVYRLFQGQK